MKRIAHILAVASALMLCTACGGFGSQKRVTAKVQDKEAYALGQRHAAEVVAVASDEGAVQDALLDVRARITNISAKVSQQSAHDYEAGFTDGIRSGSDSLARVMGL